MRRVDIQKVNKKVAVRGVAKPLGFGKAGRVRSRSRPEWCGLSAQRSALLLRERLSSEAGTGQDRDGISHCLDLLGSCVLSQVVIRNDEVAFLVKRSDLRDDGLHLCLQSAMRSFGLVLLLLQCRFVGLHCNNLLARRIPGGLRVGEALLVGLLGGEKSEFFRSKKSARALPQ